MEGGGSPTCTGELSGRPGDWGGGGLRGSPVLLTGVPECLAPAAELDVCHGACFPALFARAPGLITSGLLETAAGPAGNRGSFGIASETVPGWNFRTDSWVRTGSKNRMCIGIRNCSGVRPRSPSLAALSPSLPAAPYKLHRAGVFRGWSDPRCCSSDSSLRIRHPWLQRWRCRRCSSTGGRRSRRGSTRASSPRLRSRPTWPARRRTTTCGTCFAARWGSRTIGTPRPRRLGFVGLLGAGGRRASHRARVGFLAASVASGRLSHFERPHKEGG